MHSPCSSRRTHSELFSPIYVRGPRRTTEKITGSASVSRWPWQRTAIQRNRNVSRRPRRTTRTWWDTNEDLSLSILFSDETHPLAPRVIHDLSDVHDLSGLFREQVSMARRLVGTDKLPELNVRAIDMAKELDRVFERYANFFVLNGLAGNNRTAEDETLRATVLRQYIGDAAMDTIRPTAANKTYEELRDALIAKYKPAYSETHVRSQFFRCTMTEGQTSRDFLLQCWQAIRRTSCADENEQLQWVLTCFITRHSNEEVRRAFDIKAPATEAEALRMADEVESKQRERMATQKINAVLQDTATPQQSAEVHTVNFRNKNKSAGPSSRPFGQGSSRPSGGGGAPCNSCGGSEKCREGRCPGQRATCYECGKRGHLGRVCRQRLARQRGSPKPQSTNECDTAGSGYAERREHQQHRHDAASAARYQESGYEPSFQPADELYTFRDVQRQQMDYLHELSARAGQGGTVQRVPKCGGRRGVDEIEFQPSGVSTDEVSVPCTERKKTHDVWFEPIEINHRRAYVKIDTGAKVNVMSRRHFLELGLSPRLLRESRVVLVSFSQQLVQPIGCFTELVTINGRQIPMQFQVVTWRRQIFVRSKRFEYVSERDFTAYTETRRGPQKFSAAQSPISLG